MHASPSQYQWMISYIAWTYFNCAPDLPFRILCGGQRVARVATESVPNWRARDGLLRRESNSAIETDRIPIQRLVFKRASVPPGWVAPRRVADDSGRRSKFDPPELIAAVSVRPPAKAVARCSATTSKALPAPRYRQVKLPMLMLRELRFVAGELDLECRERLRPGNRCLAQPPL
jgi:hypothetical protein